MLERLLCASLFLGIAGGPAWGQSSDFARAGTLSHIAAGGSWDTTISLINASSAPVSVRILFRADDGSALTLPLSVILQGATQSVTASTLERVINANSTLIVDAGLQLADNVVGWADVLSTGAISGFAIFRSICPTCTVSEGTVPLQSQSQPALIVPYDDKAGYVMGVALANLSSTPATITATIWDENGNLLAGPPINIAGNGHTAFVLPTALPLTAGNRGMVLFQNPSGGGLDGLGLRFSPYGTFTSVPIVQKALSQVPRITSISPSIGQAGNTVSLTINGSNLAGVTAVQFSPSTDITVSNVVASATLVTATVTLGAGAAPGPRNVSVSSPAGISNSAVYTLVGSSSSPQLTYLTPTSGLAGTTVAVIVNGSNLATATTAQFTPSAGINVTYVGGFMGPALDSQIIVDIEIAASAAPGPRTISLTSPSGTSNTLAFSVVSSTQVPQITSLNPSSVQAGSSAALTITGVNLAGATALQFSPSTGITVSSLTASALQVTATVTIAAGTTAGQRTVTVLSPNGTSNTLPFTIAGPAQVPQITTLNPSNAQAGTTVALAISGANLTGVTGLQFSPSTGISVSGVNATSTQVAATVIINTGATVGPRTVSVSSAGGTSNTLTFTVLAASQPPQITSLNPTSAQAGSTIALAINGTNLGGVTGVQFSSPTGVTVSNVNATATQVTATISIDVDANTGARNVNVLSPGGASNSVTFTVLARSTPGLYDGQWAGVTSQGRDLSFTVTNNNITAYSYGVNFSGLPASCPTGMTVTSGSTTSIPISGNTFSTSAFTGTFQSATYVSGSANWSLNLPGCIASGTGDWSATKR